jgi:hypothetical protein
LQGPPEAHPQKQKENEKAACCGDEVSEAKTRVRRNLKHARASRASSTTLRGRNEAKDMHEKERQDVANSPLVVRKEYATALTASTDTTTMTVTWR